MDTLTDAMRAAHAADSRMESRALHAYRECSHPETEECPEGCPCACVDCMDHMTYLDLVARSED